jgi:cell division protein FtsW
MLCEQVLLWTGILLAIFGVLMIYSTTGVLSNERFGDSFTFVRKQLLALGLGIFLMYVLSRVPIAFLKRLSVFAFPVAFLLTIIPFIPGISHSAGGAARWISFGGFQLQPGEFVKVLFVVFLAGYFSRRQKGLRTFIGGVLIPLGYVGLIMMLLLVQPDFGSAVIILLTALGVSLASGVQVKHLLYITLPLLVLVSGVILSSEYRMKRVLVFLNPAEDVSGRGYQLNQSLIAVGSGELQGVGLGESQQKLFFLPAAHTDFIFAVIAEELGFLGAVVVIVSFLFLFLAGMRIARRCAEDPFSFALATGLTLLLAVPACLNMGVVTGLLPTKGLVLPFVGYGGTSLMASLAVLGLLLAVSSQNYTGRSPEVS